MNIHANPAAASAVRSMAIFACLFVPPLAKAEEPAMQPLHLVKECSQFVGKPGDFCSVIKSDLAAIPVGSKIYYFDSNQVSAILSSSIVLDAGNGSLAIGHCSVNNPEATGTCTFSAGSGALQGLRALVTLTADANGTDYHWDGGYMMVP